MIKVTIYRNNKSNYAGFKSQGHAGYAKHGEDVVCSAVSVLVINTVNSIIEFTDDIIKTEIDEKKGVIKCKLDTPSEKTVLLIDSLILGLNGIINNYNGEYIKIIFKEV